MSCTEGFEPTFRPAPAVEVTSILRRRVEAHVGRFAATRWHWTIPIQPGEPAKNRADPASGGEGAGIAARQFDRFRCEVLPQLWRSDFCDHLS